MASRPARKADRKMVRAPRVLDITPSSAVHLVRLLQQIEDITVADDCGLDIDLSACEVISRAAALLLTAQIERSWTRRPRCLNGYSPTSVEAIARLNGVGFYRHLDFYVPNALSDPEQVDALTVMSGTGVTEDLSKRLEEVAVLAGQNFGDADFVDHIYAALSEAMANIHGHGYMKGIENGAVGPHQVEFVQPLAATDIIAQAKAEALERWWITGHYDPVLDELQLCALDHGHSIPVIAPLRMRAAMDEYWEANPERRPKERFRATDSEVVEAVARARREGYGTDRRGRGFPNMIGLVENEAASGGVTVLSGQALYEFRMDGGDEPAVERCFQLSKRFNGTLIEWRIGGAKSWQGGGDES